MTDTPEKDPKPLVIVAALLVAILYLAAGTPELRFMEGASAIKILHARAILSGQGYTDIGRLDSPPEIVRPPGFAYLVAGVVGLFGENMFALKLANNIFAPLGFLALFVLLRRRTEDAYLSMSIALAAYLLPNMFHIARYLEAEILFSSLFFIAIAIFERASDRDFGGRRLLFAFGLVLALAIMVRTVAFVLVPGAMLALFFRGGPAWKRRLGWAGVIVGVWVLVGGGWMLRNQMVAPTGEMTYLDKVLSGKPVHSIYWLAEDHRVPLMAKPRRATLMDIGARAIPNSIFLIRQGLANAWPECSAWTVPKLLAVAALPLLLVLFGFFRGLFLKRRLLDFTTGIYLVVILFYSYQDNRFLLPIAPFILLYSAMGIRSAAKTAFRSNPDRGVEIGRMVSILAMTALIVIFSTKDVRRLFEPPSPMPIIEVNPHLRISSPNLGAYHSASLLEWVHTNSSPDDRVLFHSYSPCALITERECSAIPMVGPERLMRFIDESGITLVVVDDEARHARAYMAAFTPRYLLPAIKAYPERFKILANAPDSYARVLRVVR